VHQPDTGRGDPARGAGRASPAGRRGSRTGSSPRAGAGRPRAAGRRRPAACFPPGCSTRRPASGTRAPPHRRSPCAAAPPLPAGPDPGRPRTGAWRATRAARGTHPGASAPRR
jgi:hypothetical protein